MTTAAPSTSVVSSGGRSAISVCAICLETASQEAFLDKCFHSFCYQCIVKWHKYLGSRSSQALSSIRCPLCKCESTSIIHDFNGRTFQRHYVNQEHKNQLLSDSHAFRMLFYTSRQGLSKCIFDVQQYWKQQKYLRKNIWLQSWLRREIQTLTQDLDSDIIVHHIDGVVETFFKRGSKGGKGSPQDKRDEFRVLLTEAARAFLAEKTDQFVDELELFLASGLNMEAYDKVCMQHLTPSQVSKESNKNEIYDSTLQDHYLHFLDVDTDEFY